MQYNKFHIIDKSTLFSYFFNFNIRIPHVYIRNELSLTVTNKLGAKQKC